MPVASTTSESNPAPRDRRRRALRALGPLLLYLLASWLCFGRAVSGDFGSEAIASTQGESGAFMWFLSWWPHAIGHGVNPFFTDQIFAPHGYNLSWATAIPGPSLVLAPVTIAFGPVVAYNVLVVLAPALSAWTAHLLCRHLTQGATAPSLLAGYVFGFSPLVLGAARGAPNLALIAMIPLVVLLLLRGSEGSIGPRRLVAGLTAALTFQFLTSTEYFALLTVFGGAILGALALWGRSARPALRRVARPLVLGYALTGVVVSPLLFYMLFRDHLNPVHADPQVYSSDLLSFVVPTQLQRVGRGRFAEAAATFDLPGGLGGGGYAYVGLPLLVIVVVFAVQRWHLLVARVAVLSFAGIALASLGPRLHIANAETIWLPWEPLTHLPLVRYALPARFPALMFLALAVIVAIWLADRPGVLRWGAALAGVALLLPNLGGGLWKVDAGTPAFFSGPAHERVLSNRDRVLVVPPAGAGTRWHAVADMAFPMALAYVGASPDADTRDPLVASLYSGQLSPASPAQLQRFIARRQITVIVVGPGAAGRPQDLFASLGVTPRVIGGVVVYRLAPPPPDG